MSNKKAIGILSIVLLLVSLLLLGCTSNTSDKECEQLKSNVLFKGGYATVYFDTVDGTSHTHKFDVRTLNYYVVEGAYNRNIINRYKQNVSKEIIDTLYDQERTQRFYVNGTFSPMRYLKTDGGNRIAVANYLAFEDTESVKPLALYILNKSRNDTEFVKNVLYLKSQLNDYTSNIVNQPRYPLETFLEGGGDCGASSIFVGSMIKAAHPDWTVQIWFINSKDMSRETENVDHAIIYVNNSNGIKYFIETTADTPEEALSRYAEKHVAGWAFNFV